MADFGHRLARELEELGFVRALADRPIASGADSQCTVQALQLLLGPDPFPGLREQFFVHNLEFRSALPNPFF
jgi:hypothetical protein